MAAPIPSSSPAKWPEQIHQTETQQDFPVLALPLRAQAIIAQNVFGKDTPRELRNLNIRHLTETVVPCAIKDGMEATEKDDLSGQKVLKEYESQIFRELIQSMATLSAVDPSDSEEKVALYISRFTSSGLEDREAVINFFSDVARATPAAHFFDDITLQSIIIANDRIESFLKQMHQVAPHTLHNLLLLYNTKRRALIDSFTQFHAEVKKLSQPQLASLFNQVIEGKTVKDADPVVTTLVQQWNELYAQAGTSMKRDERNTFLKFCKSQQVSSVKEVQAPNSKELLATMLKVVMPKILKEICSLGPILIKALSPEEIKNHALWPAKLSTIEIAKAPMQHVEEYLASFSPEDRQERIENLIELTEKVVQPLLQTCLPLVPKDLYPYLVPTIQAKLVDDLELLRSFL